MKDVIKCPNCGNDIEISSLYRHQVEEEVAGKQKSEWEKREREIRESISKKTEEEFELKIKDRQNENQELRDRNKELSDQILELTKSIRELKDSEDRKDLSRQKKFFEDLEKAKEEAGKFEREKAGLEVAELQKKLSDTQNALTDAQTKAKQGSQQLQGEVLELDLEEKLKTTFIYDEISPVGKGVQGADVVQKVRNQAGKTAGLILWETKRAKWTPSWLAKLREDGRKNDASVVVLVCENVPKDIDTFKVMDGVLVTSTLYALPLAGILRRSVMQIAAAKNAAENKDENLEYLYHYIQSDAFRNRVESFAEGIKIMQDDLLSEKRSMERVWKKREIQIQRTFSNLSRMFGELQGIVPSLPDIKTLSLPEDTPEEKE